MKRFVCLFLLVFLSAPAFPQSAEITPNENLVVEGIPKIPASLAETVERYTNFRGAEPLSLQRVAQRSLMVAASLAKMAKASTLQPTKTRNFKDSHTSTSRASNTIT